jgi:hypothetical protein
MRERSNAVRGVAGDRVGLGWQLAVGRWVENLWISTGFEYIGDWKRLRRFE